MGGFKTCTENLIHLGSEGNWHERVVKKFIKSMSEMSGKPGKTPTRSFFCINTTFLGQRRSYFFHTNILLLLIIFLLVLFLYGLFNKGSNMCLSGYLNIIPHVFFLFRSLLAVRRPWPTCVQVTSSWPSRESRP